MNMAYKTEIVKVLTNEWKSTNKIRTEISAMRGKKANYSLVQVTLLRMEMKGEVVSFKHERIHLWKLPESNPNNKNNLEKSLKEIEQW